VFVVFKQFVRWLANNTSHLETLPKNIDDREMRITVGQREVATLSKEQVKKLLAEANDRTRLYCLLGLNCALTQQDMADLQPSEVDWERRTITRKRSKTRKHEGVPTVSYPLWPETFALLLKERSHNPTRVLLTRDGLPLKTEVIGEKGKLKKTDVVRLAINRLAKKAGIDLSLKTLKKTSASLIRGHREYMGLESLFLGQSDRTIAHKHYAASPQELLNEAIGWLRLELGIVNDEAKPTTTNTASKPAPPLPTPEADRQP
jgi:integrase